MAGQSRRVEDTAVHHLSHGLCHGDSGGGELYSPGHWRLLREAGPQSRSVNMLQCYILDWIYWIYIIEDTSVDLARSYL